MRVKKTFKCYSDVTINTLRIENTVPQELSWHYKLFILTMQFKNIISTVSPKDPW